MKQRGNSSGSLVPFASFRQLTSFFLNPSFLEQWEPLLLLLLSKRKKSCSGSCYLKTSGQLQRKEHHKFIIIGKEVFSACFRSKLKAITLRGKEATYSSSWQMTCRIWEGKGTLLVKLVMVNMREKCWTIKLVSKCHSMECSKDTSLPFLQDSSPWSYICCSA